MAGPKHLPLLVVGGNGVIGKAFATQLRKRGESFLTTTREQGELPPGTIHLDLAADPLPALPGCAAALICAAITRQDQCRQNPAATRQVNVVQTIKLIRQLVDAGTFVVFLSTNLVFDGRQPLRKAEEPQSPKFEYGRQKAELEQALTPWLDRAAIVRLTKVFQPGLPLIQKWRDELTADRAVNAFSDYLCSPISIATVIDGLNRIMSERRPGIWQFSGATDVSYADLARGVAELCRADPSLVKAAPAPPGLLEDLPPHTTLDPNRARNELGLVFPDAKHVLAGCLGLAVPD